MITYISLNLPIYLQHFILKIDLNKYQEEFTEQNKIS